MIDVMRSILHIIKDYNKSLRREQRKSIITHLKTNFLDHHLLEKGEDDRRNYSLSKEIVEEAWARYRPDESDPQRRRIQLRKDLSQIYGPKFMARIIHNVRK